MEISQCTKMLLVFLIISCFILKHSPLALFEMAHFLPSCVISFSSTNVFHLCLGVSPIGPGVNYSTLSIIALVIYRSSLCPALLYLCPIVLRTDFSKDLSTFVWSCVFESTVPSLIPKQPHKAWTHCPQCCALNINAVCISDYSITLRRSNHYRLFRLVE